METNEAGKVQASYTYGNDLISSINHTRTTINYFHYDGLGSVRQMTDDTGAVVASYTYDSFGNVIAQTTGGGMAYHTPGENDPLNKAGIILLACFISGLGFVTVRSKPIRRIGGRRGILLILVLSTALITISIPTSTAQQAPDAVGNPYGFTGESQFGEADDLIFLRARYYSPSIGRFISRDPIHYAGGINLYGYCQNNPVNYVDPSGEAAVIWWAAAGVALIAILWSTYGGRTALCRGLYMVDQYISEQNPLEQPKEPSEENGEQCPTERPFDNIRKFCKEQGLYGPEEISDYL